MSKPTTAEDELRELVRLAKRLRQLQKHAQVKGADKATLAKAEEEFDRALVLASDFRTADLPWDAAGGT